MRFQLDLIDQPSQVEVIGGARFAIWKHSIPQTVPNMSRSFFVVTAVCVLAMLFAAKYVYLATAGGDFLPMKGFAIALLGVLMVLPLLAGYLARSRKADIQGGPPARPASVPREAIPAFVRARAADSSLGLSFGWLWVEGGVLCYRGEGFDFVLSRHDFKVKRGKPLKPGVPHFLSVPKKAGSYAVSFFTGYPTGKGTKLDPELWKKLLPALEVFDRSTSVVESVYPPIRSGFEDVNPWGIFRVFAVAAGFTFMLLLTVPLFVPMRGSPLAIALAGSAQILVVGLIPFLSIGSKRARNKSLDKLKGSGEL